MRWKWQRSRIGFTLTRWRANGFPVTVHARCLILQFEIVAVVIPSITVDTHEQDYIQSAVPKTHRNPSSSKDSPVSRLRTVV